MVYGQSVGDNCLQGNPVNLDYSAPQEEAPYIGACQPIGPHNY